MWWSSVPSSPTTLSCAWDLQSEVTEEIICDMCRSEAVTMNRQINRSIIYYPPHRLEISLKICMEGNISSQKHSISRAAAWWGNNSQKVCTLAVMMQVLRRTMKYQNGHWKSDILTNMKGSNLAVFSLSMIVPNRIQYRSRMTNAAGNNTLFMSYQAMSKNNPSKYHHYVGI